jgi:hypothetical protein
VVDPRRLDPTEIAFHVAALAAFAPAEDAGRKRVA